jgi:hypothetical protein
VERVVRNALATWQAAGGCRESQNPLLVFEKKAYVDVMESSRRHAATVRFRQRNVRFCEKI